MNKLICFDFDGTLVDSWTPFSDLALRYTREKNLPELCLETLKTGYGYPDENEFWKGLPTDEQRKNLYQLFEIADAPTHLMRPGEVPTPFDGALDTLEGLKKKGFTLAIVTARPEEGLLDIIDHYNAASFFSGHRCHDDIIRRNERTKPHPDQLISMMKELNFSAEDTMMIGDTCMDMLMAKAANVDSIGVTWGNHDVDRLSENGATHIVHEHFSDIADVIEKWAL